MGFVNHATLLVRMRLCYSKLIPGGVPTTEVFDQVRIISAAQQFWIWQKMMRAVVVVVGGK